MNPLNYASLEASKRLVEERANPTPTLALLKALAAQEGKEIQNVSKG